MNVPAEFREGLTPALQQAMNVYNRPQKWIKFGFSTSEDAITWTVFSALVRSGAVPDLWRELTGSDLSTHMTPSVLLWGVPINPAQDEGHRVRRQLEEISDALGEDARRRTEPDVVIDAGRDGITIIEVKNMSANDYKEPSSRFDRYLDSECFADPPSAKATGLYELIRNWRLGCEMAGRRPFTLVNLVRHRHLRREERRLAPLIPTLATGGNRRPTVVGWEDLIDQLALGKNELLREYLADHFG